MRYYCDICLRDFKKKSKYSHLKSKSHKEFEKYIHMFLSLEIVDLKDVEEIMYLYTKDHFKNFNHYLLKGQVILVFIDNQDQDYIYLITSMIDNTTFNSRSNFLREAIVSLKTEGYHFNYIAEIYIITLAHKRDMTYDFYMKHNMSAFEWKLNAMINKNKILENRFPQKWRHAIITKFECYGVY